MTDNPACRDISFGARVGGGFSFIIYFIEDGGFDLHSLNLPSRE